MYMHTAFEHSYAMSREEHNFFKTVPNKDLETPPPGYIFRRARTADYERILEICSGEFTGIDYLPSLYFTILRNPDKYMFVAEKDGVVVCTHLNQIMDGGKTLFSGGGRSAKEVRGDKIFMIFAQYCRLQVLRLRPGLQRLRGMSMHKDFWKAELDQKRLGMQLKLIRHIVMVADHASLHSFSFLDNPAFISDLKARYGHVEMHQVTREELTDIFEDDDIHKKLFPEQLILCGHDALGIVPANINLLFTEGRYIVATQKQDAVVTMYSYQCPAGLTMLMRYHGVFQPVYATSAIIKCLSQLKQHYQKGELVVPIKLPEDPGLERVREFCKELPCYTGEEKAYGKVSMCMENAFSDPFPKFNSNL